MAKIRRDKQRETPALATTSLPDIIFMLIFFFMATTTMKEVDYKVIIRPPSASEVQKIENKSLLRYVYIGKPNTDNQKQFGSETRIQLNDAFADIPQIEEFIIMERSAMKEEDQGLMTVAIRADQETRMGVIQDVKQALRRAYALRINYIATSRGSY
jgi:biopolymer transport protein ExbD